MEEHDKRSFLLDLMDAAGLGAKDLDGEVGCLQISPNNCQSLMFNGPYRIFREMRKEMRKEKIR